MEAAEEHQEQPGNEPPREISTKTIFALVLLTVVVSFIGAFVTISTILDIPVPEPISRSSSTAHVGFTIEQPPEPAAAGAQVGFAIEPE